jgi:dTDP-4-dehydrorhamnose reductase
LDYYLTSERFLDEEIDKYPPHTHGSNGKHGYADVEAIRVKFDEPSGPSVLLKECWDRYNIPMAVTEVHVHGSPHDQIRWFHYIWKTCVDLKNQGVDIKAVTAWAMFGSFGWSSLLTTNPGEYECGVFDIQPGYPAPTDYTDFLRRLSRDPNTSHRALSEKGWWESEERFQYRHFDEVSRQLNWPNRKTG